MGFPRLSAAWSAYRTYNGVPEYRTYDGVPDVRLCGAPSPL
jgi:hypothetical protein